MNAEEGIEASESFYLDSKSGLESPPFWHLSIYDKKTFRGLCNAHRQVLCFVTRNVSFSNSSSRISSQECGVRQV